MLLVFLAFLNRARSLTLCRHQAMLRQTCVMVKTHIVLRYLVWATTGVYIVQLRMWTLVVIKWLVENLLSCSLLDSSDRRGINHNWLRLWLGVVSYGMSRAAADTTFFWVGTALWVLCDWPLISNTRLICRTLRRLNLASDLGRRNYSTIGSWSRFFSGIF